FRSFDTPSAHADEIFAPPALKRGLICRHFTNFQEFAEYAPKLNGVDEDLLISWLVKYGFRGQIFPSDAGLLMRKLRGDFFHDIEGNIIPGLDLRKYGVRFAGRIPCGQSTFLVTWYVDEQNQIIDIDTDMVFRHFDGP
ncbi:MAG: hypothetical protein GDA36_06995, partial [Rhodobacteraceae bacterium]|nr:hypothetical protein [Paracoccaceae bacterium]